MKNNICKFYNKEEDGHVFRYNICKDGQHVLATDSLREAIYTAQQMGGYEREVYTTLPDGIHSKLSYACYGSLIDNSLEEVFF